MVQWLAQLAADLEEPGSDFYPDHDTILLFFLVLPICRTLKITQSKRLHSCYRSLSLEIPTETISKPNQIFVRYLHILQHGLSGPGNIKLLLSTVP